MKGIVNQIYSFLCRQEDPTFLEPFIRMGSRYAVRWDEPELVEDPAMPTGSSREKPESRGREKR
jgi:hypothetical protein